MRHDLTSSTVLPARKYPITSTKGKFRSKKRASQVHGSGKAHLNGIPSKRNTYRHRATIADEKTSNHHTDTCLNPASTTISFPPPVSYVEDPPISSIDKLATFYKFPPLPPVMPTLTAPVPPQHPPYAGGLIMAGRYITSLCPPRSKPSDGGCYRSIQEPRQPIPGWTDGSHTWRPLVYGLTSSAWKSFHQRDMCLPLDPSEEAPGRAPKDASNPSPSSPTLTNKAVHSAPAAYHRPSSPSDEELIKQFSASFVRRPDPRGHVTAPKRPSMRQNVDIHLSPLSSPDTSPPSVKKDSFLADYSDKGRGQSVQSRPWSYDNVKTYEAMPLQTKKMKKMQRTLVGGEEKLVEIEVEVAPKRLFLFAPTVVS